ncbi:MAG TPA: regulatory protein RecX [Acidiferrobacteraceae bacterium]|nr:regulatory protein RecX [Acidiferrobacteraceae bacterium]HEX20698.1 regulatory protein RecX [Acidiferrobacteraceae bacterium]
MAMNMLARREHSAYELQQKLSRKGCRNDLALSVVLQLQTDGLQSDSSFTRAYRRYRSNRGFGPVRIQLELERKGVASEIIRQWLDFNALEWYEAVKRVRIKKYGSELPNDYPERARQARFLHYRGFTHEQIDHAMSTEHCE